MGVALTHKSIKTTMILRTMMMPFQAQDQVLYTKAQTKWLSGVCGGGDIAKEEIKWLPSVPHK